MRRFFGRRRVCHRIPISHRQAEIGEHFLMWYQFVILKPFVGFGNGLALDVGKRFIVRGGIPQPCGDRICHDFQEANYSVELADIKLIKQLMSMLFIRGHRVGGGTLSQLNALRHGTPGQAVTMSQSSSQALIDCRSKVSLRQSGLGFQGLAPTGARFFGFSGRFQNAAEIQ